MSAMERVTRRMLDNALPYQVAVNLSDGGNADGTLRRLYCMNLNIGPGHETAIVHDVDKYIFCFADLRDANRFRSQFGGKLWVASSLRLMSLGFLPRNRAAHTGRRERSHQTCICF